MLTQSSEEGDTTIPDVSFNVSQDGALFIQSSRSAHAFDHKSTIANLTQAWLNERHAPELLPYKRAWVEELIDAVERQTAFIMDNAATNSEQKFISMLYQNEIERIKFILRSYLRTRLYKIEKFTLQLLRRPDYDVIMSPQEIMYARRYQELTEAHNHESFLKELPISQRKQDEKVGDLDMVVKSNLDAPVFIRALEDVGPVKLGSHSEIVLEKNDIFIVRYRDISHLLAEGSVRLI